MEGNNDDQANEEERRRRWREIYGDMVPERIVDTKIGEVLYMLYTLYTFTYIIYKNV